MSANYFKIALFSFSRSPHTYLKIASCCVVITFVIMHGSPDYKSGTSTLPLRMAVDFPQVEQMARLLSNGTAYNKKSGIFSPKKTATIFKLQLITKSE